MAGMFPTMVADPNDRNRRHTDAATETWPTPLKVAYWHCIFGHLPAAGS